MQNYSIKIFFEYWPGISTTYIQLRKPFPLKEDGLKQTKDTLREKQQLAIEGRPAEVPGKLLINPVQRILLSRSTSARGQQGNNYPGRGEQVPALGQTLNGCGAFFSLAPCVNFYQQD